MPYIMRWDSTIESKAKAGTVVYDCFSHDYGLSNDDTRATGVDHVSVTLNKDGSYPFFTVPVYYLTPVEG